MRCAVSGNAALLAGSGHGSWLDSLREGSIEFVAVGPSGSRSARLMEFRNLDAVLLTCHDGNCVPGEGARNADDDALRRTGREMVRFARARRLPVVGVGHGAEFLGLYFGARLRARSGQQPGDRFLDLRIAPGIGLSGAGVTRSGSALCDPAGFPRVLRPIAWDAHGDIAGFVHRDEPILGIHWQPASPADGAADLILDVLRGRFRDEPADAHTELRAG